MRQSFSKFWFYLVSPTKRRQEIKTGGGHWPTEVGTSPFVIYGKDVYLLFVYENNIKKAQKKLEKAMEVLSQLNNTEFEIIPVPEDWFVGNNIIYTMRSMRKLWNLDDLMSLLKAGFRLDIKKLKTEVNNKITLNKKWTKKFEKLLSLIEKYERKPQNEKLLIEIIQMANCLDIFIKDKILVKLD